MEVKKASWYIRRLKPMTLKEIIWRVGQYSMQLSEKRRYQARIPIIHSSIYGQFVEQKLKDSDITRFPLYKNNVMKVDPFMDTFTIYDNFKVKIGDINWNSGFFTPNSWPDKMSYKISYKQDNRIGDSRVNWELNRHHIFQLLAKQFFLSQDPHYKEVISRLFYQWVDENPFLTGISYTSVMEIAIRSFSWMVVLWFLEQAGEKDALSTDIKKGILNNMQYVRKHYSQYSSANNHCIVEIVILGLSGLIFNIRSWVDLALEILQNEITKQNFPDGVNKEQSVYYQTFEMEAFALFVLAMRKNGLNYSSVLDKNLQKMCAFIADLSDINGDIADLGDKDDGKLLSLSINSTNYYTYVLQFLSILLGKNYTKFDKISENIHWLFPVEDIKRERPLYPSNSSKCYRIGGHTIMKYTDKGKQRLLTFDHAELGYGAIAAHGHTDALSITLSVDGEKIMIDPGTYVYHMDSEWRDYFRKTCNHNTLCLNNRNQSEMQGAFLWGGRAKTTLVESTLSTMKEYVRASHDGYKPTIHTREIMFFKPDLFIIQDILENSLSDDFTVTFCLDPKLSVKQLDNAIVELVSQKNRIYLQCSEPIKLEPCWVSKIYSKKEKSTAIKCSGNTSQTKILKTFISINRQAVIEKVL